MYQAIGEIGTRENTANNQSNEEVEVYLRVVINDATVNAQGDDISWCGAFVAWALQQAGADYLGQPEGGSGALNWESYGYPLDKPRYGAVVTVARTCVVDEDHPTATCTGRHVGFFAGTFLDENFFMLAGNQGNAVSMNVRRLSAIKAIRWPTKNGLPW